MKKRNIAFTGVMAAILLSANANAVDISVATKGYVDKNIGTLSTLNTGLAQDSAVAAINSVDTKVGTAQSAADAAQSAADEAQAAAEAAQSAADGNTEAISAITNTESPDSLASKVSALDTNKADKSGYTASQIMVTDASGAISTAASLSASQITGLGEMARQDTDSYYDKTTADSTFQVQALTQTVNLTPENASETAYPSEKAVSVAINTIDAATGGNTVAIEGMKQDIETLQGDMGEVDISAVGESVTDAISKLDSEKVDVAQQTANAVMTTDASGNVQASTQISVDQVAFDADQTAALNSGVTSTTVQNVELQGASIQTLNSAVGTESIASVGTSVTNAINALDSKKANAADLGTMASKSADDYSTTAQANELYAPKATTYTKDEVNTEIAKVTTGVSSIGNRVTALETGKADKTDLDAYVKGADMNLAQVGDDTTYIKYVTQSNGAVTAQSATLNVAAVSGLESALGDKLDATKWVPLDAECQSASGLCVLSKGTAAFNNGALGWAPVTSDSGTTGQ